MTVCCSSAPPTTGIELSAASTGHVVGATKHTWGFMAVEASAGRAPNAGTSSAPTASNGLSDAAGSYIARVDTFEFPCDCLDARMRAHPAFLFRRDRVAIGVCSDDGLCERPG